VRQQTLSKFLRLREQDELANIHRKLNQLLDGILLELNAG
jgi:hypothetical protein